MWLRLSGANPYFRKLDVSAHNHYPPHEFSNVGNAGRDRELNHRLSAVRPVAGGIVVVGDADDR